MAALASVDVAVIGGGFAGLSTARALAGHGISVCVFEREPALGRQASGRGAGLGRQLTEDDATTELAVRGAAWLREHSAAWAPTGGILTFDDAGRAEAYVEQARRFGIAYEVIDKAGVVARWPALAELPIAAAIFVPGDGVIDVRGLLAEYAAGLAIHHVAVASVAPGPDGVTLATAGGTLRARVVVDAAGAWAGLLSGDPPLASFKRHLFTVASPAPAPAPYVWHLGEAELYVRPDGAGTLMCPCDARPTPPIDHAPDPDAAALLHARFAGVPGLAAAPITRTWACQRAFTPDRRMRIGRDPRRPWLVWAAGLGGHGATASPAVGELAAAAAVEALAGSRRNETSY